MNRPDMYAVEWNGELWQSIFPRAEAEKSQLHTSCNDAIDYMVNGHGIDRSKIIVFGLVI